VQIKQERIMLSMSVMLFVMMGSFRKRNRFLSIPKTRSTALRADSHLYSVHSICIINIVYTVHILDTYSTYSAYHTCSIMCGGCVCGVYVHTCWPTALAAGWWAKVGDRFQNIAIISVIPNMVKAGYRG
jgi:hypothetical protein